MTLKSTARAPRKTKVASAIDTPESVFGCSGRRLAAATGFGIATHVATSTAVISLMSYALALPTLSGALWVISFVLTFLTALSAGAWVSNRVVEFVIDKRDLAVIRTARQLFNFRKEVTS